jgi:hypothetical protein
MTSKTHTKNSQDHVGMDAASPKEYMAEVRRMFEITCPAFETDSTRCISLMLDSMTSPAIESRETQFSDSPHLSSHHGRKPKKLKALRAGDEMCMHLLANFSELKAVEEDGEPLLECTMTFCGSNMNGAYCRASANMPVLFAGGGFRHGQHLGLDKEFNSRRSNRVVSMLQRLGIETEKFASATGTMRGLEMI